MKRYSWLILGLMLLTSCQMSQDDNVLAQVGEKRLLLSDVLHQMPLDADSAAYVGRYVDQWVEAELLYQQGARHLSNYKELMQQVEDYRRTLISQTYERELLRQHEQDLSDEELEAFYAQYGKQLLLREPLIKGFYAKVPIDKKGKHKNLKSWLKQLQEGSTDHLEEMEQYLQLHAVDYDGFLDQWMPLTFVADRLPEQVVDPASFLKLKIYELTDDDFSYFLLLTDYRLDGEQMPYEYALPQIRELLLNQRSREFLEQSHQEMRQHALQTGLLKLSSSAGNTETKQE